MSEKEEKKIIEDYNLKPNHLGGHLNRTNIDQPLLEHLKNKLNINSMLDIGFGTGGMKKIADELNIKWFGVDGDPTVIENSDNTLLHDFCVGQATIEKTFDLIWCTEFLEHVEEKYIPNYMPLFKLGKLAVVTAAPPGWPGHHHVNCREESYWIDVFKKYGFNYDNAKTIEFKSISKMNPENKGYRYGERKNFFLKAGLVFTNGNRT